jgi:hypothetical protein
VAGLLFFASLAAVGSAPAATAVADIARQFDTHPLVMIGEWHRNAQQHQFLRALVHDPAFACRVDDIVVEFGNARLQYIADAWSRGKPVSEAELQSMWRETEVPFTWNSPVYREFYEAVREVNLNRLCPHPLRLVLADPPIDWSRVKTAKDFEALGDRDAYFADVVEREVLARGHHALLIAGALHVLRKMPPGDDRPLDRTVVQILDQRHPGALFAVALVTSPEAAKALAMPPPPSFRAVRGSALEREDFGLIAPAWTATPVVVDGKHEWKLGASDAWPRMGEVVDGILYLGGDKTRLFPSPKIYLDPVYQKQLRERAAIIRDFNGQDFGPVLDDLVKEAEASP